MPAAGVPVVVRGCLIGPAHGSCAKRSARSSQLTALALKARTQCRSPGGPMEGGS